jgi:hypothetical protein
MKIRLTLLFFLLALATNGQAQKVENFKLEDAISGKMFELADHVDAKGIVLVFTSLNCPFSKLYEDRVLSLHEKFAKEDFVFALINPHTGIDEEESPQELAKRAKEKNYPFPFLMDGEQVITQRLNISKVPEVVLISSSPMGFTIAYRGAIDNNPQVASGASIKYLENALVSLSQRKNPSPSSARAVGCNVKRVTE